MAYVRLCCVHNGALGHFDVAQACLSLVHGSAQPLDVEEVTLAATEDRPETTLFDAHALCFGVFADHDRMAEQQLRWMGPTLKGIVAPVAVIASRLECNYCTSFFPPHPLFFSPIIFPLFQLGPVFSQIRHVNLWCFWDNSVGC